MTTFRSTSLVFAVLVSTLASAQESWYVGCKGRLAVPGALKLWKGVWVAKTDEGAEIFAHYESLSGDEADVFFAKNVAEGKDFTLVPIGSKAIVTQSQEFPKYDYRRVLRIKVTSGMKKGLEGSTIWFYDGYDFLAEESVLLRSNLKNVAGAFDIDELAAFYTALNAHDTGRLNGLINLKRVVALPQGTKATLYDYNVKDDFANYMRSTRPNSIGQFIEEGDALRVRISSGPQKGSIVWVAKHDMTVTYEDSPPVKPKKAVEGHKRRP